MILPATPVRYFGCGPRVSRLRLSYRTHTNWSNREASASRIRGIHGGVLGNQRPKNEDLPGVRPASYCPQNFWLAFVFVVRSHTHPRSRSTHTHTQGQNWKTECHPQNKIISREKRQVCDVGSAAFLPKLQRRRTCIPRSL